MLIIFGAESIGISFRLFITAFATEDKPPKRKKFKKSVENAAQQPDNDGDGDMIGLTPKPVPSKRQKKKLKQMQNIGKNIDKDIEKTVAYLTKWNVQRDEWKYEKLRQIFVQKNVFDEKVFDEEQSKVAIEYLATSKVFTIYRIALHRTRFWLFMFSEFHRAPHGKTSSREPKKLLNKSMTK